MAETRRYSIARVILDLSSRHPAVGDYGSLLESSVIKVTQLCFICLSPHPEFLLPHNFGNY